MNTFYILLNQCETRDPYIRPSFVFSAFYMIAITTVNIRIFLLFT